MTSGSRGNAGWGAVPFDVDAPAERASPKAVVALVLAVAAWTPTVPFLGAVAALVLVRLARRDIVASGGRLSGLGLCRAAVVIAVVHLVALALFAVFLVLLLLGVFSGLALSR